MAKYTKFHYLRFPAILVWILCVGLVLPLLAGEEKIFFKGGYFLFSDDTQYAYGSQGISMKSKDLLIQGDTLYLDIQQSCGMIYGNIRMTPDETASATSWDAVFFTVFPLKILKISYGDTLLLEGDQTLFQAFTTFAKKAPEVLKDAPLFFEFKEFRLDKNKKMKARFVIPYMMGLPTVPFRRFTVNQGKWADRTMLKFENVNYSGIDGLSASFFLRIYEKLVKGDYQIKLYERKFFGLEGHKRGILFSGDLNLLPDNKQKELFKISSLFNSGEKTFQLKFLHVIDIKAFRYAISQSISGRENQPTALEFQSDFTFKPLKVIMPKVEFTHNLKHSYTYQLSTPISLVKKLNLNVGWQRKIIKDNYNSDTSDLNTSLGYDASVFTLSSNFNYSRNLIEEQVRKNFSVNFKLKPLTFLDNNIALNITSFYMFSQLPYGEENITRITPGVNVNIRSFGAALPFGFTLVPGFSFNHLWDNREESFTDFNYTLALQKSIGNFSAAIEYALASRYRAENFWIEGSNRQNLNINFLLEDKYRKQYSFLLRLYHNNDLVMENISFTGSCQLPFDFKLSAFLLYYNLEEKFQTMEIFIEKIFRKKIKIQGGYSLALKRFFVKFLTI